jgi:type I restriction enzyme S subunit
MEVKPGYKQTEVGVIPEEWRDCDISDLCQLQRGFDLTEATRKHGDIPVYSSSGLSYFHNEARLQPPSVITGRKGMLGKVYFVDEPCWPHDTTLWVKDFKGNDPRFVAMFLGQFRLERFDAATSVPTLNRNNVFGVPIKLPSPPEQRAIATALSDVDGLLGGLDRLIAKKRDLKQAAMQQLLTGQTRLPGFHGEWEVKKLESLTCLLTNGFVGTATSAYVDGDDGVLYIQGYNVLENGFDFHGIKRVTKSFHNQHQKSCLRQGDLLTIQTGNIGVTAMVPTELEGANCHALVISRFTKNASDPSFYCHYFNSERSKTKFKEIETGTTMKHLNVGDMKSLLLPSPPLAEQTAIAEVLSEMDGELAVLEQRREKTRALKQAMMQELLTGRTRIL